MPLFAEFTSEQDRATAPVDTSFQTLGQPCQRFQVQKDNTKGSALLRESACHTKASGSIKEVCVWC